MKLSDLRKKLNEKPAEKKPESCPCCGETETLKGDSWFKCECIRHWPVAQEKCDLHSPKKKFTFNINGETQFYLGGKPFPGFYGEPLKKKPSELGYGVPPLLKRPSAVLTDEAVEGLAVATGTSGECIRKMIDEFAENEEFEKRKEAMKDLGSSFSSIFRKKK